jgi:SAM-dependent methyltransferase
VADQGDAVGPDWLSYHLATLDRKPRPLLRAACDLLGAGAGRTAVDLGCGAGADVLALLADGWSVVAVDREQAGLDLLRGRVTADDAGQVRIVRASFTEVALPHAHLIHAGYSVPFCHPEDFSDVWTGIRRALSPGGVFAGQLFGVRDSWASRDAMSFHSEAQVMGLLEGMEVLRLDEAEWDGKAMSGPKHWHVYDILAREPG